MTIEHHDGGGGLLQTVSRLVESGLAAGLAVTGFAAGLLLGVGGWSIVMGLIGGLLAPRLHRLPDALYNSDHAHDADGPLDGWFDGE